MISGRIFSSRVALFERIEVFANGATAPTALALIDHFGSGNPACPIGIDLDDAGVDGEALTTDQSLGHATLEHTLEHEAQSIALAKAPVAVL